MSRSNGSSTNPLKPPVRGRPFARGNGGRPRGAQNRATQVALALVDGQAEAVLRAGLECALAGDPQMLKFFLGRILPREWPVKIDLPKIECADDLVEATAAVTRAAAEGQISASEGSALATILNANAEAINLADVVKRIDELEAKVKGY